MEKIEEEFFNIYDIPYQPINKEQREQLQKLVDKVDSSKNTLFEKLKNNQEKGWLRFNVQHVFDAIYFLNTKYKKEWDNGSN